MAKDQSLVNRLLTAAKCESKSRQKRNWYTKLSAKQQAEIMSALKQSESSGVCIKDFARAIKSVFAVDRDPDTIARTLKELASK
jgi:hypothetical protein